MDSVSALYRLGENLIADFQVWQMIWEMELGRGKIIYKPRVSVIKLIFLGSKITLLYLSRDAGQEL